MADVFISYSRHDEPFVERLRAALADAGIDVWVDREDIGPAVEWRREIELGIEGADVFAFVISPDSLRSEPCRRELEHALATHKRIAPLLRREPDSVPVPDELAAATTSSFAPTRFPPRPRRAAGRDRGPARVGATAHAAAGACRGMAGPRQGRELSAARQRPGRRRALARRAGSRPRAAADAAADRVPARLPRRRHPPPADHDRRRRRCPRGQRGPGRGRARAAKRGHPPARRGGPTGAAGAVARARRRRDRRGRGGPLEGS